MHESWKQHISVYSGIFIGFRTQNYTAPSGTLINTTKLGYTDEGYILVFEKKGEAKKWIEQHSATSSKYEIVKIWNSRETGYRWNVKRSSNRGLKYSPDFLI